MKLKIARQSIARRLQRVVGAATALILALTLWFKYHTGRAVIEEPTDAIAHSQIRATPRKGSEIKAVGPADGARNEVARAELNSRSTGAGLGI